MTESRKVTGERDTHPAVLCLANQKGGVGKTTTAVQLADGLTRLGYRVLLIDLDSQSNAGSIFVDRDEILADRSAYALFKDRRAPAALIHRTRNEKLDLLPSVFRLAEVESLLAGAVDGFFRLSEALNELNGYDFIIIDCPPSLGLLTLNAFVASTHLIIPLQTARFSLDGIQGILETGQTVQKRFNDRLRIFGALLTMFNPRNTISREVLDSIGEFLPLFRTRISRSIVVEEAHLFGNTIFEYRPASRPAEDYMNFTNEVVNGVQKG